jgi:hypothetical protein
VLEHPRSVYVPEFRHDLLKGHADRLLAIRDRIRERLFEAMAKRTVRLADMQPFFADVGLEEEAAVRVEEQQLREALGRLEKWARGG